MEYRQCGATGLSVPVIGMGTWRTFDVRVQDDEANCRAIVDAALDAGTTLFDTSPMYGDAERVLANALDGRRDRAIVADKVWTSSRAEGRLQAEQALDWYGGVVDIYQVHNLVAWRDQLSLLEELRESGKVRVIGATHYQHSQLGELMSVMRTDRLQMVQIPYSAADRLVEREVLPLANALGLGVMVMQPLGTGALIRRTPPSSALRPLLEFGVETWAQALLKWIVSDPRVHCVLPATSKVAHAAENAAAGDPPWFDKETRAYIARLASQ